MNVTVALCMRMAFAQRIRRRTSNAASLKEGRSGRTPQSAGGAAVLVRCGAEEGGWKPAAVATETEMEAAPPPPPPIRLLLLLSPKPLV